MSEFVELGGYIVSGEPLVYPDNTTMTGDGTVENPFGVKSTDLFVQNPLFTGTSGTSAYIGWNNETVLWEDTPSSAISISEPFSNFETIKIYAYAKEQNSGMARTFEFPGTNTSFDFHIFDYNMEGTAVVNYLTRYVINGMNFSASVTNHWWQTIGAVTGGTWSGPGSNPIVPIKVIGINRKV